MSPRIDLFRKSQVMLLGLLLSTSGNLLAVGFRLPNQDPEGIARGNAFTATADNPSAIYYNPAGITQLEGQQLSVGSYFITTGIDYTSQTGRTASTDRDFQAVPQIYYVFSPDESNWSFGLGLYAPYGLGIDYGSDTTFGTIAKDGQLLYATLNPVAAYQLTPCLSLAAGVTMNYSDVSLTRSIYSAADEFSFDGDGYTTGFNLGLLWQPLPEWSFGLNYRSPTEIDYSGESIAKPYSDHSKTSATLNFPYFIVAGVSYRPNEKWNFEFDLDWTNWDSVNDSLFRGTFGGDQVFRFRYESGFMYNFGVTRQLGDGYYLSAGYIYSENSVPNESFTPLNPDSNLHLGSLGFGHRGERFSWALGYHFAYNGGRDVSGNVSSSLTGETSDGHYETFNHAVNVSVRYSF